ncbi:hypothetical protein TNCV_244501 [Trichonephila clavipes]|uniref:Uncharacterized protein n=1 Tax=Trichonephila clavipes TaxID=2585209 RepID=A0A8X6V6V6_TRICX|nr:hypothetical protein TNCV_244501 [Trichonephila clavipes]
MRQTRGRRNECGHIHILPENLNASNYFTTACPPGVAVGSTDHSAPRREAHARWIYRQYSQGKYPKVFTPSTAIKHNKQCSKVHARQKLPEISPLVSLNVTLVERSTIFKKIPEGSKLSNKVANDAKMVAKDAKFATNLALPPRFHQVLIESP